MLLPAALEWLKSKRETFTNSSTVSKLSSILSLAIGLAVGIFAAYLSYSCNTVLGINTILKVIYAMFAFVFGIIYLIYYLLVNRERCDPPVIILP